jgi:hypothetical protein
MRLKSPWLVVLGWTLWGACRPSPEPGLLEPPSPSQDAASDSARAMPADASAAFEPTDASPVGVDPLAADAADAADVVEGPPPCMIDEDCPSLLCARESRTCAEPSGTDGVKNGSETDVDCGGLGNAPCAAGKRCVVHEDCASLGCDDSGRCASAPSCTKTFGGRTCGTGELGDPGAHHESCCTSLEVQGFSDAAHPGKTVLLDKYEITAGRMRTFLARVSLMYGGKPDLLAWVSQHRPTVWNDGWDFILSTDTDAPGNVVMPHPSLYSTSPANVGTSYLFGSSLYVYVHGHNCFQGGGTSPQTAESYGYNTYFYPAAIMAAQNGGWPRAFSQDELDTRAMNCVPSAVLQAFCAWDGGQLATAEVLLFVSGATVGKNGRILTEGRLPPRASANTSSDGAKNPPYYRVTFNQADHTHEGAGRIAAPGRMALDRTASSPAASDTWADLRGNLNEVVLLPDAVGASSGFGLYFEGVAYESARASRNTPVNNGYPEFRAGFAGGRCMRFR